MMTPEQRQSWDFKVELAEACRDESPAPPDGDFETNLADDLLLAADDELTTLRDRTENRSALILALMVVALAVGCVLGWVANDVTRPERGDHAFATRKPELGSNSGSTARAA